MVIITIYNNWLHQLACSSHQSQSQHFILSPFYPSHVPLRPLWKGAITSRDALSHSGLLSHMWYPALLSQRSVRRQNPTEEGGESFRRTPSTLGPDDRANGASQNHWLRTDNNHQQLISLKISRYQNR